MLEFILSIFLNLVNVVSPKELINSDIWLINKNWTQNQKFSQFVAESELIINSCKSGYYLQLPRVFHGSHELWVDEKLLLKTGQIDFTKSTSFYERPTLSCDSILATDGKKMARCDCSGH